MTRPEIEHDWRGLDDDETEELVRCDSCLPAIWQSISRHAGKAAAFIVLAVLGAVVALNQ